MTTPDIAAAEAKIRQIGLSVFRRARLVAGTRARKERETMSEPLEKATADVREFGFDVWVYCNQHLGPHKTGWCTVSVRNKTRLDAQTQEEAYAECRAKEYRLYDDLEKATR